MSRLLLPRLVVLGLMLAGMVLGGPRQATAQNQGTGWSEPVPIFEANGALATPAIIADKYGQVHAFWIDRPETLDQPILTYYTRLDLPDAQPVDILTGDARNLLGVETPAGLVLGFSGTWYSTAGPSPNISAKDWSRADSVGSAYTAGGLATAPDGSVWVAYGTQGSNTILAQHYDPVQDYWEAPLLVGNTSNVSAAPDSVRVSVGPDDSLHAVWTEYQLPDGWPPIGLYYSRSLDGGQSWSQTRELAGDNYNQPNVATGPNGQIYLAWLGSAGTGGKYFQESLDGGRTWEPVVEIVPPPEGGSEGAPSLAVDGAGNIHIVYSFNNCVWHVSREQGAWLPPQCVSNERSRQIEEPIMTIGLGNQIHVLYWTDREELWYTTRTLAVPGQEPLPVPTLPPPTATAIIPSATPPPTPTALPDFGDVPPLVPAGQSGLWALIAGIVPVAVLMVVVLTSRRRK